MTLNSVNVLQAEDNPFEAKSTIGALEKITLVKNIVRINEGEAALVFMFVTGKYSRTNLYQKLLNQLPE